MANTSVSGLVSGLDTATIISQLMQIEAQPQTNLKNRVSAEQKVVTALQAINAKLAGIATKAGDLAKLANWSPSTATSSNDKVTVTADPAVAASQVDFTITSVASKYRASYTTAAVPTATGTMPANASYRITFGDGSTFDFDTGDGSLNTIAAKLNATGSHVDASLVRVGTDATTGKDTYVLNVQSESTGSKATFTIAPVSNVADTTSFLGGPASTSGGTDASILVSGQSTALTSSTNTFTDLMPGVDVTLAPDAAGSTTITVVRDVKGMSDSVKAMVDAVNSVLSDIDTQTAYNADTKTSGLLAGESSLRTLRDRLVSTVTSGVGGQSLADVGIQVDRYGKLVFDETKFQAAYSADPAGVANKFAGTATFTGTGTVTFNSATWRTQPSTGSGYAVDEANGLLGGYTATRSGTMLLGAPGTAVEGLSVTASAGASGSITYQRGFAATLEAVTQVASNSTTGTLTLSIKGHNDEIKSMNDNIADWDVRLADKQAALQRQYAALEVALGKLQDQASWLNGQISSLPKMGS